MQIIEGNALAKLCDYSFGDHHTIWDYRLTGDFKIAGPANAEFLVFCQKNQDKVITLFIDNIRLYKRGLEFKGTNAQTDAQFISYLYAHNDLLELCGQLEKNKFIIFTSHEDTPINDKIVIPPNVLKIYAVNALYNNDTIIPFPIGLQRQIGENDLRLDLMQAMVEVDNKVGTSKLLYINCGIERNPERAPLAKFETNDWCTTRFDKDSKFFPYDKYNEFLSELRDYKFVACPKGHGYDTHRIWETLYMRRVPIMLDDPYFRRLLDGFPVVWIKDWDQLTKTTLEACEPSYESAQSMDMSKLDLSVLYKNAVNKG